MFAQTIEASLTAIRTIADDHQTSIHPLAGFDCQVDTLPSGGHKAVVHFTLTAQGCGMGQFIKEDIRKKLLALPDVREAEVELVWDPPWNQSMIAISAKQQLGIE